MNTLDKILNILSTYPKGTFETNKKTKLSEIFENNIPKELNNYGVYIFTEKESNIETIVYIGKNGTINKKGQFCTHSLARRIMQGKEERFELKKKNFKVYWFVTISKSDLDSNNQLEPPVNVSNIPSVVECKLLENYYGLEGQLPKYNSAF